MVAVDNKELLSCYLITLKLRETVESGIPGTSASNGLFELPDHQKQQQRKKQQQTPSHSNIVTKDRDGGYQWVIPMIKEKLNQASQDNAAATWGKLSIYKVPQHLREGDYDHKAYVPQIVSLGPYHHGEEHLRQMDCHKWRFLHVVLKRTKQDIKVYMDSMRELEKKARACYEGPIGLSSNEFVEMMVLDGCFVLELFQGALEFTKLGYPPNDPVFAMRGSMHSIRRDMLMLENQLPLFILDRLLGLESGNLNEKGLVSKLALRFFDPLTPTDEPLTKFDQNKLEKTTFDPLSDRGLHCLDVFRTSLLRPGPQAQPMPPRFWMNRWLRANRLYGEQTIHGVTELREAGIKFKKGETDCFWDIEFKNGILRIPRLFIHNGTKSLFLNLIAFEQSHLDCSNDITSYVIFMDNLINSPEDVSYLHYRHIIKHWLGSDTEVAELFNCLCQGVAFTNNNSYLSQLSKEINQYYYQRCNVWCASLRHNYFNSPWAIISIVAAVLLLLLTSLQAFYGVYGYYRPRS